ncbi:MAG: zinc ribbon domain-containing protein [Gemmatimonadota bacterium]
MPTYEYICTSGHAFETFQKISERPKTKCPTCGKPAKRKISGGAGLVFKGSGFYITDYGKDGKGPRRDKLETPAPAPESTATAASTTESKSESKPESKSDSESKSKSESKGESKSESKSESKRADSKKAKPKAST